MFKLIRNLFVDEFDKAVKSIRLDLIGIIQLKVEEEVNKIREELAEVLKNDLEIIEKSIKSEVAKQILSGVEVELPKPKKRPGRPKKNEK